MVGLGRPIGSTGLKGEEAGQRSGELAVERYFVTQQEFRGTETLGRASEGGENPDGGGPYSWILEGHVSIYSRLLCSPDSQLPPASDRHGFDQGEFSGSGGLVFVHVAGEEVEKAVRGFFLEDDGLREEAVAGAVAGGVLFSWIGYGAAGARSIGF
jgi:hypothetical protein